MITTLAIALALTTVALDGPEWPKSYSYSASPQTKAQPAWWRALGEPELEALVDDALKENRDLRAGLEVAEAHDEALHAVPLGFLADEERVQVAPVEMRERGCRARQRVCTERHAADADHVGPQPLEDRAGDQHAPLGVEAGLPHVYVEV